MLRNLRRIRFQVGFCKIVPSDGWGRIVQKLKAILPRGVDGGKFEYFTFVRKLDSLLHNESTFEEYITCRNNNNNRSIVI